ncbi:FixH family protein [Rhodopseudomonas palustris]|uniref:FixH n=1 Tax=Rhodopseudomonas palustris (strain BisB18) TaxID=316056 RepID=Q21DE7_RHOPB
MSKPVTSPRPLTGGVVLASLLAFFAVVLGVNMTMMLLAIETLPGTEVDSAYSASIRYSNEIAAARDQAQRDWRVNARVERQPDGSASLRVEARDRNGAPLAGLTFSGRLERPADKRADKEVILAEIGDGVYRGNAVGVSPGQWDLVIEGDSTGNRMFLSKNRLVLN